jgi:hypothetical protein
MTRLPDRFVEDRALRDAARGVLAEDIDRLRTSLGEEGIASRVSTGVSSTITARVRTGARDVLAQAKAQAGDHQGVIAVLLGALILWLARGPILDWIEEFTASDDNDIDPAAPTEAAPEGDPA